jgi:aspartyl-tRNA synthetase
VADAACASPYRSHRVRELDATLTGQQLLLAGWLERKRELGSVVFFELRDEGALVQCVVEAGTPAFDAVSSARVESVLCLSGVLQARPKGTENSRQERGGLELRVRAVELLSSAEPLPFPLSGDKLEFLHNPLSMPQGGRAALEGPPEAVLAYQYDIVCNGVELSSGAIRNHRPDIMLRAFELAGYGPDEVERRFGAMLSAFKFGAPPHGGLAPGIDRMLMLLANEPNLREVIAFALTQNAEDLLMRAPSQVSPEQLQELGLTIRSRFPTA